MYSNISKRSDTYLHRLLSSSRTLELHFHLDEKLLVSLQNQYMQSVGLLAQIILVRWGKKKKYRRKEDHYLYNKNHN